MEPGILSQRQEMTYDDILLMLNMLKPYKETLTVLLDLFKSEDDFIKFLDLFAGRQISIPSRSRLFFVMFNIDVYRYYNSHLNEPDILKRTAKHFDITTQRVQAICDRVAAKK